ncbi:MAG TPA: hypothetical protein VH044_20340 [Polyangiaceae bacterium]|jgi:hypothetical protein|nr:hypothetical protein [Polyangiaceae bacterium]
MHTPRTIGVVRGALAAFMTSIALARGGTAAADETSPQPSPVAPSAQTLPPLPPGDVGPRLETVPAPSVSGTAPPVPSAGVVPSTPALPATKAPAPAPGPPVYESHPAPVFGSRGQWVLTAWSDVGVSTQAWSASDAGYVRVGFAPTLDYFVVRDVSLGLEYNVHYEDSKYYPLHAGALAETTTESVFAGVNLGFNLPMGPRVSFYPKFTVGVTRTIDSPLMRSVTIPIGSAPPDLATTTLTGPYLEIYAPLLYHPAPHFFVGAGPDFLRVFASPKGGIEQYVVQTQVDFALVVGGTYGGSEPEGAALPPAIAPVERRFGSAGQIVLDGELDAQASWRSYAAVAARNNSVFYGTLEPSLDYFVIDRLSLGIGGWVSAEHGMTGDASGIEVPENWTRWGIEPRIGVDIPFGTALSWYPRLGFTFGGGSDTAGTDANKGPGVVTERYLLFATRVTAPLLVHPTPHFFVGGGPFLYHEFTDAVLRTAEGSPEQSFENHRTTVGVSAIVGGWVR